jgi:hypothetical protein
MPERVSIRVSEAQDGRSERPATGSGQPRPANRSKFKWEPCQPRTGAVAAATMAAAIRGSGTTCSTTPDSIAARGMP